MKTKASKTTAPVQSILVPTDFSAPAQKALDYALGLAGASGAKITLLYVMEPFPTPDFVYSPLVMERDEIVAQAKERLAKSQAKSGGVIDKILVRHGVPHKEITDAARTLKCDLIVISTHGYTGLAHVFMGSTSERVVRHAACPVLVVRGQPTKGK